MPRLTEAEWRVVREAVRYLSTDNDEDAVKARAKDLGMTVRRLDKTVQRVLTKLYANKEATR